MLISEQNAEFVKFSYIPHTVLYFAAQTYYEHHIYARKFNSQ